MQDRWLRDLTRRHLFRECGVGLGKIALTALLAGRGGCPPVRSGPFHTLRGGPTMRPAWTG